MFKRKKEHGLLDMKIIRKEILKRKVENFHTRYQRWDIMILLSVILFFQILIIIHFSEWELWHLFDNSFGRMILIPKGTDRTFYNIAISYIAAYIFYLLQVHIPMYLSFKANIEIYQNAIKKEINILEELLFLKSFELKTGDKYYGLKFVTNDVINTIVRVYSNDTKKELIRNFFELHAKQMNKLSMMEMDNTLKNLYRNIISVENRDLFDIDIISNISDEEIESFSRIISVQYIRKKLRFNKYGIVPDYNFVSQDEFDKFPREIPDRIRNTKKFF